MSDFKYKFNSKKQEWETPVDLFLKLWREFKFDFDLAADMNNRMCDKFFNEEDDALSQTWNGSCWLNPPYGNRKAPLKKWIMKADAEVQKNPDLIVVAIIPARTNTEWFHNYCLGKYEIRFIKGRPKFGDADHGLPQPLMLVIFQQGINPVVKSFEYKK